MLFLERSPICQSRPFVQAAKLQGTERQGISRRRTRRVGWAIACKLQAFTYIRFCVRMYYIYIYIILLQMSEFELYNPHTHTHHTCLGIKPGVAGRYGCVGICTDSVSTCSMPRTYKTMSILNLLFTYGCGSKFNRRGYASSGPCFHLPGFHVSTGFFDAQPYVCWLAVPQRSSQPAPAPGRYAARGPPHEWSAPRARSMPRAGHSSAPTWGRGATALCPAPLLLLRQGVTIQCPEPCKELRRWPQLLLVGIVPYQPSSTRALIVAQVKIPTENPESTMSTMRMKKSLSTLGAGPASCQSSVAPESEPFWAFWRATPCRSIAFSQRCERHQAELPVTLEKRPMSLADLSKG